MADIVVIGGTGQIGSKTVTQLRAQGHDVLAASRSSGVDILTGEGLRAALEGARVVVDVSKPGTYDAASVREFFTTATENLMRAEGELGIRHHIVLSIVGSDRPHGIDFYRGKVLGEQIVRQAGVPYSIVHATQFFEFATGIAASADTDGDVTLPDALVQPAAGDDVAGFLVEAALGEPRQGEVEIAGPEQMPMADFVARVLRAAGDERPVHADAAGRYFGGHLERDTLLPGGGAVILPTSLDEWLKAARR